MNNQEIFDMLADIEEKLFSALFHYGFDGAATAEMKAAHAAAKQALEAFAKATGCHN
jgi:hypothetical protein